MEFEPSPELYPFQSRWFDSPVGRVHYVDEGRGRPILFVHGNPTWSFLYRDIIKALRHRMRCIAVDLPGFGLSVRPAGYGYTPAEHALVAGALARHLDLRDLVVMGQDWGGPIGIAVALSLADRVSGLVFGNTWYWPASDWGAKVFSTVMASPPMRKRVLEENFFVERLLPRMSSRALTALEMEHFRAVLPTPASRLGVAEMPRQIRASRPWLARLAEEVPDKLGSTPLLLPWGMRDFAFAPGKYVPRWRADFRDLEFLPLPHASHYFQQDAPEEVAAAILGRFSSEAAAAGSRAGAGDATPGRRTGVAAGTEGLLIRPVEEADAGWVAGVMARYWGGEPVVVHRTAFHPSRLPGLVAEREGEPAGLLTYDIRDGSCEIVTLNAFEHWRGTGSRLLQEVAALARARGCGRLWLVTTNDNVDALRFYQRRGFRLCGLRLGEVGWTRERKPGIPGSGSHGIAIRDEIELERSLEEARLPGKP